MGKKDEHKGGKKGHYLSPGVYVDEVPSGSRPIEAVGTAVAAFVGLSPLSTSFAEVLQGMAAIRDRLQH